MSTLKLVPRSLPENVADHGDKIISALNRAGELVQLDIDAGQAPKGVMVIFWREHEDGTAEESWITSGFSHIEGVGLLAKTLHDVQTFGLNGLPAEDEEIEDDGA